MRDKIFNDPKTGFVHVANYITAQQQSEGKRMQPYNILSDADVNKLLTDNCTDPGTAVGYVNRLLVVSGLLLGL